MRSAAPRPPGLAAPHDQPVPGHLTTASVLHRAKLLSLAPERTGQFLPETGALQPAQMLGPAQPQRIISLSARHPA